MSLNHQQKNLKKKNNNSNNSALLKKIQILEEKLNNLPQNNNNNNNAKKILLLENHIDSFTKKILKLEKLSNRSVIPKTNLKANNTDDIKILKNVINDDLNKLKIKIEKNENIIKKILFN